MAVDCCHLATADHRCLFAMSAPLSAAGFTAAPHGYVEHMRPDVELRLPVDSAYVSVLRATTVSLAARMDFTIDDIEDLRMAVGEACAMVLTCADENSDLTCAYFMTKGEVTITVTVPSASPEMPDRDGFAWQMLSALTTDASASADEGTFSVTMTMHSTATA
jgi:serine/threonine-protein kinase RsbW